MLAGTARVVLHDLRQGSPTDGATLSLDLSGDHDRGLFIPPGVAHGFASLTDLTLWYLVDGYYNPEDELGVAWDDPAIAGDWGRRPTRCCRTATRRTRSGPSSRRAASPTWACAPEPTGGPVRPRVRRSGRLRP